MRASHRTHLFAVPAPTRTETAAAPDPRTDAELVALAIHDADAFAELYRRHANQVYWYLLSRAGSPEDAEELTQHVFLRALEALPGYQRRGLPFRSWLLAIARNAAMDVYRRQRRVFPWDHVDAANLPASEEGPEAFAIKREHAVEIRIQIARLDREKQELLALRFASRLTISEIAAVTGKNQAAVKKQLQRVLRRLKEQCDEE